MKACKSMRVRQLTEFDDLRTILYVSPMDAQYLLNFVCNIFIY